ncbi:MAG: nickel pincer cofactor biosynthesis protein LarB [Desulfobulbaceae bacterium]
MNRQDLIQLLTQVQNHSLSLEAAADRLSHLPGEKLSSALLDHQRILRTGLPEAVFAENKSVSQLEEILAAMLDRRGVVLATRVSPDKAAAVMDRLDGLTYHETGRVLTGNEHLVTTEDSRGTVVIVTAGTSDLRVAEEARISLECFGHPVKTVYDAGVAGLHRILAHTELLREASVLIVAAGMEGALPSVVAGMVAAPVIGVPTSVGYGAGAGGFSALLGMLNSCAPGMAVVNIDNGFGAACMAAAINRKTPPRSPDGC